MQCPRLINRNCRTSPVALHWSQGLLWAPDNRESPLCRAIVVVCRVAGFTTFCTSGTLSMPCFRHCMPFRRPHDAFAHVAQRQELDNPLPCLLGHQNNRKLPIFSIQRYGIFKVAQQYCRSMCRLSRARRRHTVARLLCGPRPLRRGPLRGDVCGRRRRRHAWQQNKMLLSVGVPLATTHPLKKLFSKPNLGGPNGLNLRETHPLRW